MTAFENYAPGRLGARLRIARSFPNGNESTTNNTKHMRKMAEADLAMVVKATAICTESEETFILTRRHSEVVIGIEIK